MMKPSDRDERDAAAQQRGRGVQPVPLAVGEVRDRVPGRSGCASQPGPAGLGERDELVAQPVGLLLGRPGIGDAGRGRGRHELEVGEPERARERAAGDVDELHAAVGHRHMRWNMMPRRNSRSSSRSW